ncbi:MAG: DUF2489 domain-containing protein, partial [Nitrospirae bacterium]|nr:DUF2489 domain-containing protein [Nitrospirota bacterium]
IADRDPDFDVFVAIESETDHLPLHAQQHLWDPEALATLAPEFAKTEIWATSFTPTACHSLISRFGGGAP